MMSVFLLMAKFMLSHFSHVQLFETLWDVTHQAPLSRGFFQVIILKRAAFPTPGDIPDPGIEPISSKSPALAGGYFTTNTTWAARWLRVILEGDARKNIKWWPERSCKR